MIRANVVGASGYAGGELIRLLLSSPGVALQGASSESLAGKPIGRAHPNLRGATDLGFTTLSELEPADIRAGLRLYLAAWAVTGLVIAGLWWASGGHLIVP